jgi:alpha-D-ribose 1-methylphosphonate 5-triphosphate synthase subunit PhnL
MDQMSILANGSAHRPAQQPTRESTRESTLEVSELTKSFTLHNLGGRTIRGLNGVSLQVGAGEHVALAGTSGAGKSTLLKCVFRTYLPTSGSIAFRDGEGNRHELLSLSDSELSNLREREIGYVSQFLRAEPRRTTLDVVIRAGRTRGMSASEASDAAALALREVNIDESVWQSYPSVLSGGEKQRVNLAAGTIAPPLLLLLDEPVSALDPQNREAVLRRIGGLSASGVAVLAVFHDLDAIRLLADRVVVLADGRVVDEGKPTDLLTQKGFRND